MKPLSVLLGIHAELEELFFEHQRRLLRFDFADALRTLEAYEAAILKHIEDENTHLLPIYAGRGEQLKGAAVQMFYDEHEKIKAHLVLFKDEIRNLLSDPEPDRKLIWLLEREAFYKKLCDHHDIRETRFLYPELDRITSDTEKAELLGRVTESFAQKEEYEGRRSG
jgi:hemerythrin-like domain-containing protein